MSASSKPARETRVGLVARATDWVFGYDFFLSYSHKDGQNLPERLKARLEHAGFRVFLDKTEYVAGMDLARETRRCIRKSRNLVVITRPVALLSTWVKREIEAFRAAGRVPIIIDINQSLSAAPETSTTAEMIRAADWLRLNATLTNPDGDPPDEIVRQLVRGFTHTRQEVKRQRVFASAALVLSVTTVIAAWQAYEATQQRRVAERNFQTALQTADSVVLNIARGLRTVEGMKVETVRTILERAEASFKRLVEAAPEDRSLLRSQVVMYNEFVETYLALGDTTRALAAAQMSVEIARRHVRIAGADRMSRQQLARSLTKLGDAFHEIGKYPDARAAHEEALEVRRQFLQEKPGDDLATWEMTGSLLRLGGVAQEVDDYRLAAQLFAQSLEIRQRINPPNLPNRRDLVVNQILLGDVLMKLRDYDGAAKTFEAALDLSRSLLKSKDDSTQFQRDVAIALQWRGDHARAIKDFARALAAYEESRSLFEKMASKDDENAEWKRDVTIALSRIGAVQFSLGDRPAARQTFSEVVVSRRALAKKHPDTTTYATDLAEALYDLASTANGGERLPLLAEAKASLEAVRHKTRLRAEHESLLEKVSKEINGHN